jgi:hypothetical protein
MQHHAARRTLLSRNNAPRPAHLPTPASLGAAARAAASSHRALGLCQLSLLGRGARREVITVCCHAGPAAAAADCATAGRAVHSEGAAAASACCSGRHGIHRRGEAATLATACGGASAPGGRACVTGRESQPASQRTRCGVRVNERAPRASGVAGQGEQEWRARVRVWDAWQGHPHAHSVFFKHQHTCVARLAVAACRAAAQHRQLRVLQRERACCALQLLRRPRGPRHASTGCCRRQRLCQLGGVRRAAHGVGLRLVKQQQGQDSTLACELRPDACQGARVHLNLYTSTHQPPTAHRTAQPGTHNQRAADHARACQVVVLAAAALGTLERGASLAAVAAARGPATPDGARQVHLCMHEQAAGQASA